MNLEKQHQFSINYIPKRIISLVPSQTELLYDLGLEKSIVGLTKFCIHPVSAKKSKTIIGGTKSIHIEKIKALQPDIILCNKEENTKKIVMSCSQIAPTHVSDIYNLEDAKNLIRDYGKIFAKDLEASGIIKKINFQQEAFERFVLQKPILKVAYFIWKSPWMVAANRTFIHYLLTLNKFHNVYDTLDRYPEVSIQKMADEKAPELIFLSSEPFPFKEEHTKEIKTHTQETSIIFVDGEMFSWYGSRLIKAFDYFKKLRISIEQLSR